MRGRGVLTPKTELLQVGVELEDVGHLASGMLASGSDDMPATTGTPATTGAPATTDAPATTGAPIAHIPIATYQSCSAVVAVETPALPQASCAKPQPWLQCPRRASRSPGAAAFVAGRAPAPQWASPSHVVIFSLSLFVTPPKPFFFFEVCGSLVQRKQIFFKQ